MKATKLAIALAGLMVGGASLAQSSVTLYGRVNTSIEWQSQKYSRTVIDINRPALTGSVENTTRSYDQKFSGITQRNNSSRFGLKGNEDLSNGWSAKFKIENGVKSDSGGGSTAGRAAWVGLGNDKFGEVRLGFEGGGDLSPFYAQFDDNTVQLNHDTGTSSVLYANDFDYLDVARPATGRYYDPKSNTTRWGVEGAADRMFPTGLSNLSTSFGKGGGGNNLTYLSPDFVLSPAAGSLGFGFRVGLNSFDNTTNDSIRSHGSDLGAGRESDTKVYDLVLNYKRGGLYLGLGGQFSGGLGGTYGNSVADFRPLVTGQRTVTNKFSRFQLVGSYTFDSKAQVAGVVGFGKDKRRMFREDVNLSTGATQSDDLFRFENKLRYIQLGASMPIGKFDIGANAAWLRGKVTGNEYFFENSPTRVDMYSNKVTRQQFQVGAGYNFSPRTRVYTFLDFQKTKETGYNRDVEDLALGVQTGQDWRGSVKQTTLGLGLRHNF